MKTIVTVRYVKYQYLFKFLLKMLAKLIKYICTNLTLFYNLIRN